MGRASFGKYELIAELGHGGMADVFLAVQAGPAGSGFRKLNVVKRLRTDLLDDPEFVEMLVDEARIASRLGHPNIIHTTETGTVDEQHFIATEYLDGQPLHRLEARSAERSKQGEDPPLAREQRYVILLDVLAGLHYAHELADYDGKPLEIVHRGVTPRNTFVTYDGQVKIVDFGIAKAANRSAETRQGIVKGSIRYMAPEQAIGLTVDRRADIFAVGVMLWESAVNRRFWHEKDDFDIVKALVANELPPMPLEVDPTVPVEIDRILRRALASRAEERYATAEDLRVELEQYLASVDMLIAPRRRLGQTVADLFKEKREEMRALIERQLLAATPSLGEPPSVCGDSSGGRTALLMTVPPPLSIPPVAIGRTPLSEPSMPAAFSGKAPGVGDTLPSRGRTLPSPGTPSLPTTALPASASSPGSKNAGIMLAAGAALSLLVVGGIWRASITAANVAPVRSPTMTSPASVVVRVNATPASALIRIDDSAPEPIPYERAFPSDRAVHRITITADGYETRVEHVTFAQDLLMALDLVAKNDRPSKNDVPVVSASISSNPPSAPARPVMATVARPPPKASSPVGAPPQSSDIRLAPPKKEAAHVDRSDPWSR